MLFPNLILILLSIRGESIGFSIDESIILDAILKPIEERSLRLYQNLIRSNYEFMKIPGIPQPNPEENALRLEEEALIQFLKHGGSEIGEWGKPVVLPPNLSYKLEEKIAMQFEKHFFNVYVSDLISVHRRLNDTRAPYCRQPGLYSDSLPKTSVIICFHNEAWSTLLRTIHSVLNQSPSELLEEIILIDDFSDFQHLKQPLDDYLVNLPKVKLVRNLKREGLTRSRLKGKSVAKAKILTFLDSHCECLTGWLEPLIDRIVHNPNHICSPAIDIIRYDTFKFEYSNGIMVGGFVWSLDYVWTYVPFHEMVRRQYSWEPYLTPTIAGGLFSVDRDFFDHLGGYDDELLFWGGDNLELSFKTWMCGGVLEIIPCSRVGHVFRRDSPIKWVTNPNEVVRRNLVRVAKVWMDDYAKYYYQRFNIDPEQVNYGDISRQVELRKRLKCKSFDWYVNNVYPELFVPDKSAARGEVRSLLYVNTLDKSDLCLDSHENQQVASVYLYPCHGIGKSQQWFYTQHAEIRNFKYCLDYNEKTGDVQLLECHNEPNHDLKAWYYYKHVNLIVLSGTSDCLAIAENYSMVTVEPCQQIPRMQWELENFNETAYMEIQFPCQLRPDPL